ncbi:MAG TPA: sulfate ABC transporter permease subunit CysT [Planctomycetaceae bacterium]|nr:sulfate ABC transporter permease subunit CysT [Planctomycetaceae bacterium]HRE99828.1 sulfate ABC transporter permease subunit CysT [Pirellulaceae bacterium]
MSSTFRRPSPLPGFAPTMAYTLVYLLLIVLLPLSSLFLQLGNLTWESFREAVFDARVLASYRLTFGLSAAAALFDLVFGFLVAWTLVRYRFPGRDLLDATIDIPFTLPTAVSGIALTAIWASNGWIGSWLDGFGIRVAYTSWGIFLALAFIGLPFVVRTLQPAIEELDAEQEAAAAGLGAGRFAIFARVLLPALVPAAVTGFALAFARGLGEYGSVVFISGNMPFRTEIVSLLIVTKLEQYDTNGAAAIAVVMLGASFLILLAINLLQQRVRRLLGSEG